MANIITSRYAVLSIDDEDKNEAVGVSKNKKIQNRKTGSFKCNEQALSKSETCKEEKGSKNFRVKKKKSQIKTFINENLTNSEQWEEWMTRDKNFKENFDEQLSKAILLSKQDYEEKKEIYEFLKSECEKTDKKTQKKDATGNELDNRILKNSITDNSQLSPTNSNNMYNSDKEINFTIKPASLNCNANNRLNPCNTHSQENLALVTLQAILENKDKEIFQLKSENEKLNNLLIDVKVRNSKLCQIIAHGEMKEKVEMLMEIEKLQIINDDLSTEINSLKIQLEQEKSKFKHILTERKEK